MTVNDMKGNHPQDNNLQDNHDLPSEADPLEELLRPRLSAAVSALWEHESPSAQQQKLWIALADEAETSIVGSMTAASPMVSIADDSGNNTTDLSNLNAVTGSGQLISSSEKDEMLAFGQRCQRAATEAYALVQMRQAREVVGFLPLPFESYLEVLTKKVVVELPQTLSSGSGQRWLQLARLGQSLGVEWQQMWVHLRLTLAQEAVGLPMLPGRARTDAPSDVLHACDTALASLEAHYEGVDREELTALNQATAETYRSIPSHRPLRTKP